LEHRPVPLPSLEAAPAEDEPRPSPQRGPARDERPAPAHPQVAVQDEAALEPQQQVLPDRLDREQSAAVQPLDEPARCRARMGRLDLEPLADERLQAPRRAVESVALGHYARSDSTRNLGTRRKCCSSRLPTRTANPSCSAVAATATSFAGINAPFSLSVATTSAQRSAISRPKSTMGTRATSASTFARRADARPTRSARRTPMSSSA